MQNCISEFPKQCESKELPDQICGSSYRSENNFTEARLGGKILDSDVSMNKAFCQMNIPMEDLSVLPHGQSRENNKLREHMK